jgi:hypothetical protein
MQDRKNPTQILLVSRRFALRNLAHTNFYKEEHTLGLACHPSLLLRTKTNMCKRNGNKRTQRRPVSPPYALLWRASCKRFSSFNNFINCIGILPKTKQGHQRL